MSNAAKLKKKAVELEQKKQFDKALSFYIQFLQESDGSIDDVDVPLYNRVGDLLLRTGNASDALSYFEKAIDLYAERGFHNNAIALCNRVLRQSPGRTAIYYKLGKISATKGFKSDAKKNFLEYADRMQKAGQIDEAFRALKEFADLCPDQDDIRLMLADQLTKQNRQDEALEQLQKLHDRLDGEGRNAEARATADRMKSIDPEAVPRVSGSHRPQKSQDLIFLDTSFAQAARSGKPEPAAPPPGRQVSDPDLVVLTLANQPDVPVSPVHNAAVADAFNLDIDAPGDDEGASPALQMIDVDDEGLDLGPAAAVSEDVVADVAEDVEAAVETASAPEELDVASEENFVLPPAAELDAALFNLDGEADAPDLAAEPSAYVSGPPLSIDYAGDLAADVVLPTASGDLFDFRSPPRSDDDGIFATPTSSLDPDVAFPSFDLDDALPSADEVTSGASLAAALGGDDTLGDDIAGFDLPGDPASLRHDTEVAAAAPSAPAGASTAPLELDWALSETPSRPAASADLDGLDVVDDAPPVTGRVHDERDTADDPGSAAVSAEATDWTGDDAVIEIPIESLVDTSAGPNAVDEVPAADLSAGTSDRDTVDVVVASDDPPPTRRDDVEPAPHGEADSKPVADAEPDRRAGWEVQREHAERLLEAGDRAAGVGELEQVAAELERIGDLERSLSIVDELIRLLPDSVRHHQKRVELAFRSNDRVKLIDAYLELGDALFRSGEERKARVVYQRVLELAPDDPRARMAVESVSSMSPPMGSGAIPAIAPGTPAPESRTVPPRHRDTHVPYQSATGNGGRPGAGVASSTSSRRPAPLDRSAAAEGEFVDLGDLLRSGEIPKSTRMVAEEKPPTGDEQADFQEMLKRFKQGVAENVDEEDYESHYDLGVAYKEMGLIDEAVAEFQKALRGSSNRVRVCEALGQCFVEKEQYHVAASVLTRAIALGETDDHHLVGVLYLLGLAMEALNKPGAALDYYQRVFAVDIEFRNVSERISAIERKAT